MCAWFNSVRAFLCKSLDGLGVLVPLRKEIRSVISVSVWKVKRVVTTRTLYLHIRCTPKRTESVRVCSLNREDVKSEPKLSASELRVYEVHLLWSNSLLAYNFTGEHFHEIKLPSCLVLLG